MIDDGDVGEADALDYDGALTKGGRFSSVAWPPFLNWAYASRGQAPKINNEAKANQPSLRITTPLPGNAIYEPRIGGTCRGNPAFVGIDARLS